MKKLSLTIQIASASLFSACGGGGGGGESPDAGSSSGKVWKVTATVASDTCGERINTVNQDFIVNGSGSNLIIDTTLTKTVGVESADGFTFSYQERNGACVRTYSGVFSNVTDATATVQLSSQSSCNAAQCSSAWIGSAVAGELGSPKFSSDLGAEPESPVEKVRGENCVPPTSDLLYRPSAFECNGAAWVGLITPRFRAAYSVVLRANGFRNDRDPNNPECGLASCSPYKTQKTIELPEYQVRCLGSNGYDAVMRRAKRISIKFTAALEESDKLNPLKFEQYCLDNTGQPLN